jgi:hypothetical protein
LSAWIGAPALCLVGTATLMVFALADGGGGGLLGQPPPLFF